MARRAPTRIWGALLGEQGRLLALTGTGLVVVISFAAAVKPLADGQIGLGEALQLMGLAMVPMLQFSLPFAAGFAATMTYHRFAAEHEATAAMAGGIGHRSLIVPAVGLGAVLTVVLAVLMNIVIPGFLRSMERVVAENASRMISSAVERGESIHLADWDVHAAGVTTLAPSEGSGAFDGLLMTDVFAVQRDKGGDVDAYISAARVAVWMFGGSDVGEDGAREDTISVQLVFDDADIVQSGRDNGPPVTLWQKRFISPRYTVPGTFSEDPKFMSYGDLVALRTNPERIQKVQTLRTNLAARIAEHQMIEELDTRLRTEGVGELIDEAVDNRVTIVGSALVRERGGWRVRRSEGAEHVRLVRTDGGGTETVHLARDVYVSVDKQSGGAGLMSEKRIARLEVRAERVVTVRNDGQGADAERRAMSIPGLRTTTDHLTPLLEKPVKELQKQSKEIALDAEEEAGGAITKARKRLKDRVADLHREITSKQHERAAFSLTGLLMVMTGAVVGFKMKDSLALPVYMWSFFPALFAVITIGAGQSLAHKSGEIGLVVLWGGVIAMGMFTCIEYGKLRKH